MVLEQSVDRPPLRVCVCLFVFVLSLVVFWVLYGDVAAGGRSPSCAIETG